MTTVSLENNEWQQLLNVIANAHGPGINWLVVNPLIVKISQQVGPADEAARTTNRSGNGATEERPAA